MLNCKSALSQYGLKPFVGLGVLIGAAVFARLGETDKRAGRKARFFLKRRSAWEIIFLAPGEKE